MRYQLCQWIFSHNKLPIGTEPELINNAWGFSYAFFPYLAQILGVPIMKLFSLLSSSEAVLLAGARMVSVISGGLVFPICCLIGNEIFNDDKKTLIFSATIACTPQLAFLSSYVNNDIFAFCLCLFIVYICVLGYKNDWHISLVVLLGVVSGICMLSYYNAYGYILMGFVFFVYSMASKKLGIKKVLSLILVYGLVTLMLCGWYFIRNYFIFDGDILGFNINDCYQEMYAIEELKPRNCPNGVNLGMGFFDYFIKPGNFGRYNWFIDTYRSYVGVFGNLEFILSPIIYLLYGLLYLVGFIAAYVNIIKSKLYKKYLAYIVMGAFTFGIPCFLSMYNSYFSDYQPQGRYVISTLIMVGLFTTLGWSYIFDSIGKKSKKDSLTQVLSYGYCTLLFIVYLASLLIYYFPNVCVSPII